MMHNCHISFFMAKATFQKLLVGQTINTARTVEKILERKVFGQTQTFMLTHKIPFHRVQRDKDHKQQQVKVNALLLPDFS